jgi:uncharacterized protein
VRLLDNAGHEHDAPVDPRWAALAGLDELKTDDTSSKNVGAAETGASKEKR